MENLIIETSTHTPEINFDSEKNVLAIIGESYPENTREFFEPMFTWLDQYLKTIDEQTVTVNVELIYFNSSTAKVLMNFFDTLEEFAEEGANITVNWIYDERNENAVEYGEDFQEDLENVQFNLVRKQIPKE